MIKTIKNLDSIDLDLLVNRSIEEGYRMVKRLQDDYHNGTNRFDQMGEALFGYFADGIWAIGGINIEIDAQFANSGRIRRVYVHPSVRGNGVGKQLVQHIMAHGTEHFSQITCNVGPLESHGFYEHLGFQKISHPRITHVYPTG